MPRDVLEEAPFRLGFGDDAGDVGPQVAGIVLAFPAPRIAEGLAGITGRDDMNAAAPWSAVEGSQIVPDNSRSQGRVRHPCHESGCCTCVPLDETHSAISGFGEMQAEVEPADTGAKAEAAKLFMSDGGMNNHTQGPFRCTRGARVKGSRLAASMSGCGSAA
jgi:hypothetical protein